MITDNDVGLDSLRTLNLGENALYGAEKNTCSLTLNGSDVLE